MSSSILDELQFVQVHDDEPKKVVIKLRRQQEQNMLNQDDEVRGSQNMKVSHSTRPSQIMTSSWSHNNKSILQRISTLSKGSICIESNDEQIYDQENSKILKKLGENDRFPCGCCTIDTSRNCQICKGKKRLNGGDKLIKFFEFILEFKTGQNQSYRPNKERLNSKQNIPNQHCNIYYSTINPRIHEQIEQNEFRFSINNERQRVVSMMEHQQKFKNQKDVHFNYSCDKCQMDPIQGLRYRCPDCQNYDLCGQCFHKCGHVHQMVKMQLKNNHKTLQKISNLLKIKNKGGLGSSIRNSQSTIKSTSNKGYKSWIK